MCVDASLLSSYQVARGSSMLDTAGMFKAWWGEAVLNACHVLNRVPTKNSEVTPYEGWKGRKPSLSYLRTWGCLVKVNVPITKKHKLGSKTMDYIYLEYTHNSTCYCFLVVKFGISDMPLNMIMESRDATFFENLFPMKDSHRSPSQENDLTLEHISPIENIEHTHEHVHKGDNVVAPQRSKRQRIAKSFGDDFTVYLVDDIPKSNSEACASPDAEY